MHILCIEHSATVILAHNTRSGISVHRIAVPGAGCADACSLARTYAHA